MKIDLIKTFYYNLKNKLYSLELVVKYIKKELKFEKNSKKVLGTIKSIISKENINKFKDKKDIIFL